MSKRTIPPEDHRDYLANELFDLLERYGVTYPSDAPEADRMFACYLLFCTLGGIIFKQQGQTTFKRFIKEIEQNQK